MSPKMTSGQSPSQEQLLVQHFSRSQAYAGAYRGTSSTAHFFTMRLRRVRELLTDCPAGSVLDVGCGPGMMFRYLLDRGFECFGVDLSPNMIEECRRQFGAERAAHFAVGKIEGLAFPDSSLDLILCLGVIEYVDADAALQELVRVLKPSGTLVVSMLNGWSPYRLWERAVYRRAIRLLQAVRRDPPAPEPALRTSSERAFKRLLTQHDLRILDVVHFDFNLLVPPLDRWRPGLTVWLSNLLEPLDRSPLRGLGTGFIVKARKL